MACGNLARGCLVATLALCAQTADSPRAGATETVLAGASFEGDTAGAVARPGGPSTVAEDVWDAGTYSSGYSQVVAAGTAKRYRLSDAGSTGGTEGIRLPFSSVATEGTLTVEATATAEQTGSAGGILALEDPEDGEWPCMIGFGADGKFRAHGSGTTVGYAADAAYRFRITVHFGPSPTADYSVTDVASGDPIYESLGRSLPGDLGAGSMVFRTDTLDCGAFTVDALSAVR